LDKEKLDKKEASEDRLVSIENRINKERPADDTKFKILKE